MSSSTPNLKLMPSLLAVGYLYRMTQCPHRPITGKDSTIACITIASIRSRSRSRLLGVLFFKQNDSAVCWLRLVQGEVQSQGQGCFMFYFFKQSDSVICCVSSSKIFSWLSNSILSLKTTCHEVYFS